MSQAPLDEAAVMKGTHSGIVIAMLFPVRSGAARMTPTNDAPGG
jgi:hypothetical protein